MLCCNSLISFPLGIVANVSSIPSFGFELISSKYCKYETLVTYTVLLHTLTIHTHTHKDITSILPSQFTILFITITYYPNIHTHSKKLIHFSFTTFHSHNSHIHYPHNSHIRHPHNSHICHPHTTYIRVPNIVNICATLFNIKVNIS